MHRTVLVALVLAAPGLAGCLDAILPSAEPPTVAGSAWSMELPVTMNVVAVGFDGRLDPALLFKDVPTTRPVFNWAEEGAQHRLYLEPIQYRLDWRFHEASPEFAEAFFAAAKAASFTGPVPAYLRNYDASSGENRLAQGPLAGTPLGPTPLGRLGAGAMEMTYVKAVEVETWVEENRAAYGLAFPGAQYTIFLVDSHTNGYLPQDSYHYWYFDDGTIDADLATRADPSAGLKLPTNEPDEFHTPKDPTSMRAWGGGSDFAWIDVGAAPSWLDDRPWYPPFEDDNFDHPIWALEDDPAKLHRNLGRHIGDFALVKILRLPVYDFEWVDKWVFPIHVFIESAAISNRELPMFGVDVTTWLGAERIEKAFEDLAPWVDVEVTVEYHWLPQDDPGMAEAVRLAKLYGNSAIVSSGVLEDYVRANWDKYVPPESQDVRVLPQFFYYFDGLYTFWGPNQGGGYAAGDGWGRAWAGFDHVFDVCANPGTNLQGSCFGTKAQKWQGAGTMDMLVIHEGGHHVGLTHARDTGVLPEGGGLSEYYANWIWDSVRSVMTYRHQNPAFDQYDRDVVARGHTGWTLNLTAARIAELSAIGAQADAIRAATDGIAATESLLREGRWQDAARSGIATWKALRSAAGPLEAKPMATTVESFGGTRLVPASPGIGGNGGPVPTPIPFPEPDTALNVWAVDVEVKEGAEYLHIAFRDTRPQVGVLRFAYLGVTTADGEWNGLAFNDIFAETFVTNFRAGPGTYKAYFVTNGGLLNEYDVTIDVHYATG